MFRFPHSAKPFQIFTSHNLKKLKHTKSNKLGGDEIMKNKPKPDDRRDNVDKIEYNIGKTLQNIERANEMIDVTDDQNMKETLKEKNERRKDALKGMREEIRDEATDKKNGYK